jgi:hypothetical protein
MLRTAARILDKNLVDLFSMPLAWRSRVPAMAWSCRMPLAFAGKMEGINRKIRGLLASAFGFRDHDFQTTSLRSL